MHELSFAAQILETVQREVAGYPGCRVRRIKLRAGEMLALEPASLRFCLEGIAEGTVMEGAQVDFEEIPAEMNCPVCGKVRMRSPVDRLCPQCGEIGKPLGNTELILEEIDLDEQDNPA